MYLLFVVSTICFLMAFSLKISKLILIVILREPAELLSLRATSEKIRRELSKISMRDNYIEYVQTERKLVQLEKRMAELRDGFNGRKVIYEYGVQYGLYAILTLGLIIVSIGYRYTPVVVFGKNFNFEPFEKVLNFPTGVPNAVSTVFWIVVNNFVARTVAGYVK
ncbi:guided entry of tail-anchored proteins factor 1 [Ochlerotatus camptorhynchus]|uniref:guided entry of tail-anchored proteins factor 1 n=1 Tax=Ochlerotatus camptorhynchus TaxID=644619 RepID=UPI0031DE84D3